MFWTALELRNSKIGFVFKLSLMVTFLTLFKNDAMTRFGNTGRKIVYILNLRVSDIQ